MSVLPTTARIAEATGVSVRVVQKVLLGGQANVRVGKATAERIRLMAEDLGYRPNSAAAAISTGRFDTIAMLYSSGPHGVTFSSGLVAGVARELAKQEMHLTFAPVDDARLTSTEYMPRALREWSSDGMIISYFNDVPSRMFELIARFHIPAVWTNLKLESDCVYPDDHNGVRDATLRLLSLGHRRIAYVCSRVMGHYSAADRLAGYKAAMRSAGLQPRLITAKGKPIPTSERLERALAWVASDDRPTAVVAYEADDAIPVATAAIARGLVLGRDLSIIGVHDVPIEMGGFALATAMIDTHAVGEAAARMVLHKIEHKPETVAPLALPLRQLGGATIGPLR